MLCAYACAFCLRHQRVTIFLSICLYFHLITLFALSGAGVVARARIRFEINTLTSAKCATIICIQIWLNCGVKGLQWQRLNGWVVKRFSLLLRLLLLDARTCD